VVLVSCRNLATVVTLPTSWYLRAKLTGSGYWYHARSISRIRLYDGGRWCSSEYWVRSISVHRQLELGLWWSASCICPCFSRRSLSSSYESPLTSRSSVSNLAYHRHPPDPPINIASYLPFHPSANPTQRPTTRTIHLTELHSGPKSVRGQDQSCPSREVNEIEVGQSRLWLLLTLMRMVELGLELELDLR
jgi:hypothetical protein